MVVMGAGGGRGGRGGWEIFTKNGGKPGMGGGYNGGMG